MRFEASKQPESTTLKGHIVVSLAFSVAIQLAILQLTYLVGERAPVAARLVMAIVSIPLSAASGTLLLRKRMPGRSAFILVCFFIVAMVIAAAVTAGVDLITGSYDVP